MKRVIKAKKTYAKRKKIDVPELLDQRLALVNNELKVNSMSEEQASEVLASIEVCDSGIAVESEDTEVSIEKISNDVNFDIGFDVAAVESIQDYSIHEWQPENEVRLSPVFIMKILIEFIHRRFKQSKLIRTMYSTRIQPQSHTIYRMWLWLSKMRNCPKLNQALF